MATDQDFSALAAEFTALRRELHQQPEVGLDCVQTVSLVKSKLDAYGIAHEDIGVNSLVATVTKGDGPLTVGFRVDMDALLMSELNEFGHKSKVEGKMHACGHDGHCVSLLAFASTLKDLEFNGTVLLLFQSGEEGYEGALRIIEDGLFEKHKVDYLFGYHNMPGVPTGHIVVHRGACMASEDRIEVHVTGKSGHASMPHVCNEPFAAVADIIKGLQSIVARRVPSHERGVVSITQVHGGSMRNGIPDTVMLQGNVRTNSPAVQDLIEENVTRVVNGAAAMYGVDVELDYDRKHPVLVNTTPDAAINAAVRAVGQERVITDMVSSMAAEDFAFFLAHTKGCYVWIGNGEDSAPLHNSRFDFNDAILPQVLAFFTEVVRELL